MAYQLTREDASRGAQVVNAQRSEQARVRRAKSEVIARMVADLDADDIPVAAYAGALQLMLDVLENGTTVPIENRLDVQRTADAAKTLFTIARLASGESTSNVASVNVNADQLAARLAALQGGDITPPVATTT
jgi:hypothetical protein